MRKTQIVPFSIYEERRCQDNYPDMENWIHGTSHVTARTIQT